MSVCQQCGSPAPQVGSFCSVCGSSIALAESQASPSTASITGAQAAPVPQTASGERTGSSCPACHRDDQVVRVSGLLDSATSHTTGRAGTAGAGVVSGGIGVGVASTRFQSTSVTQLARRFAPPSMPKGQGCLTALLMLPGAFIALMGFVTLLTQISSGSLGSRIVSGIVWLLVGLIGLGLAYLPLRFISTPARKRQADWAQRWSVVRSAFYCGRDDLVFAQGSENADAPEVFVRKSFGN